MWKILLCALVALCCAVSVSADVCTERNSTCSDCVKKFECYWCAANKDLNISGPTGSPCQKRSVWKLTTSCSDTYHLYPSCKISGLAVLIITICVVVLVVVAFVTCICCCCCCGGKRSKRKWAREDDKDKREREDRRIRQEGRRTERKARNDEIRKKYGLYKDEDGGAGGTEGRYQRFDV
ncbi:pituitary tumor-transforming gene 1 protein-interacting protein-like isoform X2 [Sycon ciliatum]|uniref:pituitary tumor-transforming gene 1 protein-interacting protein-like isoform X2 n=1 Tax=Sycon ciliatum TaxID=27933 RepID=UPI0031F684F6